MFVDNVKIAFQSLNSSKWRSFLTMLGVIVGVVSVVVTVSIGEGIKHQVTNQINELGADLITVLPGNDINSSESSLFKRLNLLPDFGGGSFSVRDLTIVGGTQGVREAVPMSLITGQVSAGGQTYGNDLIVATTDGLPDVLNEGVEAGQFFAPQDNNNDVAVIGENVAQQLFHEPTPVGSSFQIRGQTFIVDGVFGQFVTNPLLPISNYNNAIFIPFGVGASLSGGSPQIYQIYVKPNNVKGTDQVAQNIQQSLSHERGGETNFTVLDQKQDLAIANETLTLLTGLIAGVAAISLIVGGIGIMNIMLVSVTERTREIGVRKAVGATNKQVFSQFLIESSAIGLMGGFIGVIISIGIDVALGILTSLKPAITAPIVLLAVGIGLVVGVIFGVMPAVRAARRNPIESLRHD